METLRAFNLSQLSEVAKLRLAAGIRKIVGFNCKLIIVEVKNINNAVCAVYRIVRDGAVSCKCACFFNGRALVEAVCSISIFKLQYAEAEAISAYAARVGLRCFTGRDHSVVVYHPTNGDTYRINSNQQTMQWELYGSCGSVRRAVADTLAGLMNWIKSRP
jgi:hypothetical protein